MGAGPVELPGDDRRAGADVGSAALGAALGAVADPLLAAVDTAVDAQRELEQQLRIEFGVKDTVFRALLVVFRLSRRGLPARTSTFARTLGLSSGAASQATGRLLAAGLVRRDADANDGRSAVLTLTESAAERFATLTRDLRTDLDRITSSISPEEQERLLDLLTQVTDVFQQHQDHRRQA